jgi:hypothetical protein
MRLRRLPLPLLTLAVALAPTPPALAADGKSDAEAKPVSVEWNLRVRNEYVDDDVYQLRADAATGRLRAGLRFRFGDHFSALLEGEGILAANDQYNSTANGNLRYPVIADAQGAEANQGWLAWTSDRFKATVGRQRLVFDNQRWIGNSGWRQNEQTFDAAALEAKLPADFTLRYAWVDRVHRVNGDDALDPLLRERDLDTHLLNLAWKRGTQQVVGYAWLHEDLDLATASTASYGLRSVTNRVRDGHGWGLSLEWAYQRQYADNPLTFSHHYWLVEPSFTHAAVTWRAGWEHLGGNGRHALQTPLATLHPFNGWADKFNTTPPGGLEDRYLGAGGKVGAAKFDWQVAWHDYRADVGGSYGTELDASLGFPLHGPVSGLLKVADYQADGFARDTKKVWLQIEWAH